MLKRIIIIIWVNDVSHNYIAYLKIDTELLLQKILKMGIITWNKK